MGSKRVSEGLNRGNGLQSGLRKGVIIHAIRFPILVSCFSRLRLSPFIPRDRLPHSGSPPLTATDVHLRLLSPYRFCSTFNNRGLTTGMVISPNSPVCIPQDCVRILHQRSDLSFISQTGDVQHDSFTQAVVVLQWLELVPNDFFLSFTFLFMMMLSMMITVSCIAESLQSSVFVRKKRASQ
jgi:hypothetical protein